MALNGNIVRQTNLSGTIVRPSGGGTVDQLFFATYGTTTNAEIETAFQAGKVCVCIRNGFTHYLVERSDANAHVFACVDGAYMRDVYVSDNTWGNDSYSLSIPEAGTATPKALGTAAVGTSLKYAREDHVHPAPEKLFESGTGSYSIQLITPSEHAANASGFLSVALGANTVASGTASFAMGQRLDGVPTTASGNRSFAFGNGVGATGANSVAFGQSTEANATCAVAVGDDTVSAGRACFVAGAYNVEDTNAVDTSHGNGARKYILIVGNGTAENARSNALTVDWDGNLVASGKMTVGTAPTANMDVATKQYVDDNSGKVTEVTNSTAGAVSIALDPEKIYHFTGALTSLSPTLTAPASGHLAHYHFDFDSGSTAPTLTLPQTVTMPSGFTVEASKHYEIDILNNYGVVMAW